MKQSAKILLHANGAYTEANGDSPRHKMALRTAGVIMRASEGIASNFLSL